MDDIKNFFGVLLLGVAIVLLSRFLAPSLILALWAMLALVYAVSLGAFEAANSGKSRFLKGLALALFAYGVMAFYGALQGNGNPLQPLASHAPQSATFAEGSIESRIEGIGNRLQRSPFKRIANQAELEQAIEQHLARFPDATVMLDYYADWCIACIEMEEKVFNQAEVQSHLSNLLWLQIDVTDQSTEQIQMMEDYGIFGPPSLLFFNKTGELSQLRILGEMHKAEFVAHLDKVRAVQSTVSQSY